MSYQAGFHFARLYYGEGAKKKRDEDKKMKRAEEAMMHTDNPHLEYDTYWEAKKKRLRGVWKMRLKLKSPKGKVIIITIVVLLVLVLLFNSAWISAVGQTFGIGEIALPGNLYNGIR